MPKREREKDEMIDLMAVPRYCTSNYDLERLEVYETMHPSFFIFFLFLDL